MARATLTRTVSIPGIQLKQVDTHSTDLSKKISVNLPLGNKSTLSTRVSGTNGTLVLPDGHEIAVSDVVDIYNLSGVIQLRGTTVSALTGNLMTFNGGTGSVPDTLGVEFVVSEQITTAFDTDDSGFIQAMAYSVDSSGTYSGPEGGAACVQFVGTNTRTVLQVTIAPKTETIIDVVAGDTSAILTDNLDLVSVIASNPLHLQRTRLIVGAVYNTSS